MRVAPAAALAPRASAFPAVAQGARLVRQVRKRQGAQAPQDHEETSYFITSQPPHDADLATLLAQN